MKVRIAILALLYIVVQAPVAEARNRKPSSDWFSEWNFYLDTSYKNVQLSQGAHRTPSFTVRGGDIWLGACFKSSTVQTAGTIVPAIWQLQTQNGPGVARVYYTRTIGVPFSAPTDLYWNIVIPPTVQGTVFCSLKKGALIGARPSVHGEEISFNRW